MANTLTISWTAPSIGSTPVSYEYAYCLSTDDIANATINSTNSTSATFYPVGNGITYKYRVRSVGISGLRSRWSQVYTIFCAPPPNRPTTTPIPVTQGPTNTPIPPTNTPIPTNGSQYVHQYLVGSGSTASYACTFNNYYTVYGNSGTFTSCTGFDKAILNDNGAPLYYAYNGNVVKVNTYYQDPIAYVGTNTFNTCPTPPDHSVVYLYGENANATIVCGQALSEDNINGYFVDAGNTLQNGTVIYDVWTTDYLGGVYKTKAPAGIYSNGTKYWTITGSDGILRNESTCPVITSWNITQFVPGVSTDSDQSDNVYQGTANCYIELNAPYSSDVTFSVTVETTNMGTQYVEVTILANRTFAFGYGTPVGAINGAAATGGCISNSTQPAISLSNHGC